MLRVFVNFVVVFTLLVSRKDFRIEPVLEYCLRCAVVLVYTKGAHEVVAAF